MSLDFNNSTSLLNSYSKYYNNQPTIWKDISKYPHHLNTNSNNDELSIKFVLKNDPSKIVKNPVKVFTVPIVDKTKKITTNPHTNTASKKRKQESAEALSSEYIGKHNKNKNTKNKNIRTCKSKNKIGKNLKKIGKYIVPAGIGFLTFKMVLIPIVLKVLALMSMKGVFLGMVSFIMASLLSLKQIVGSTARNDKKSDITFIPINIRKQDKHKEKEHEQYVQYEHQPYNYDGQYTYGT